MHPSNHSNNTAIVVECPFSSPETDGPLTYPISFVLMVRHRLGRGFVGPRGRGGGKRVRDDERQRSVAAQTAVRLHCHRCVYALSFVSQTIRGIRLKVCQAVASPPAARRGAKIRKKVIGWWKLYFVGRLWIRWWRCGRFVHRPINRLLFLSG